MMTKQTLRDRVNVFINHKRKLGYTYDTGERNLMNYLLYAEMNFPDICTPTKESVNGFLNQFSGKPGGLHNAMAPLREFSKYLTNIGVENVYLIPSKQLPKLCASPPYFFSEAEIESFFKTATIYFSTRCKSVIGRIVFPAQLHLLYCCGLRTKEARILKKKDVHLEEGYIDVNQSKGPKSRRIYISDELVDYLSKYDGQICSLLPDRVYFFPKSKDDSFGNATLRYHFEKVWLLSFPNWNGKFPRIYDFRHHFAWANINRWAREGVDVNAMIPYLMRYMGHNCIKHTLYYFRFVPDFFSDYKAMIKNLEDYIPEVDDE